MLKDTTASPLKVQELFVNANEFADHLERMVSTAHHSLADGLLVAAAFARDFKTAETLVVTHGRWLGMLSWKYGWQCSVCGKMVEGRENYCPACGARMDLE